MELLKLARAINGNVTIVEPCMINGRLDSCRPGKHKGIPVSKVFDLSGAMQSLDHHCPLMASYDKYQAHLRFNNDETVPGQIKDTICVSNKFSRCSEGAKSIGKIDKVGFQRSIANSTLTVLQLENYWRMESIGNLRKLFGVKQIKAPFNQLSFHPNHIQTVEEVLQKANIADKNFSLIHWRAEKAGMNFRECAKAVLNAKRTLLKKRFQDNDTEGGGNHSFLLLTSLNKNAEMMWSGSRQIAKTSSTSNNTALAALNYLMEEQGFLKFDELMGNRSIEDPGMLAVYDLIVATKSKDFASCARDKGHGCSDVSTQMCEKCNHVGKFGGLAISLRDSSDMHTKDSSWGCWPMSR